MMILPMVVLAVFCLLAGIFNSWIINNIIIPAQSIITNQLVYISSVLGM
jgi:formate hydrogenlyase subunit 3/multisubunit Na+/H+ antiporter MnhD subunit